MKMENPKSSSVKRSSAEGAKKKMSTSKKVIIAAIGVLLVFALVLLGLVWRKYAIIEGELNNANNLYQDAIDNTASNETEPPSSQKVDPNTGVISDFNDLYTENEDTIGHIRIPGTKLNTPVVQGTDNEYYLNHTFYKTSALGVPFADYRATIDPNNTSLNVTIYGHAAKNGTYFSALKDYRTVDFYKEHPIVEFDTIYGKGRYKVIGAMLTRVYNGGDSSPEEFNYHDYVDMTELEFNAFMEELNKRTYFNTGVDVKYGDQLITLSTCDDQIDDSLSTPYRMVVVARKVRYNELVTVDVSQAAANTEMMMPSAWQEKYGKANPYQ